MTTTTWMVGREHRVTSNDDGTSTEETRVSIMISGDGISKTTMLMSQHEAAKFIDALVNALDADDQLSGNSDDITQ